MTDEESIGHNCLDSGNSPNDNGNTMGNQGGDNSSPNGNSSNNNSNNSNVFNNSSTSNGSTTGMSSATSSLSSELRISLFALKYPYAAYRIGKYEHGSTNISTNSIRFSCAFDFPKKFVSCSYLAPDTVGTCDSRNAVRHTIWQAMIANVWNSDLAKEAGDAHEDNPNIDLSIREFQGINAFYIADQTIDLLNNAIGRSIGRRYSNVDMKTIMEDVLSEYHDNGLYVAKEVTEGFVVIKEKLSDEAYIRALEYLQLLDNDGYTIEERNNQY